MIRHILDRNIIFLILATMLSGDDITGIGYANQVSGVPHFHDDSTSRSVAENVSIGTNVGSPVSAHSPGTYGRYTLGGTDAASFTINEDNGQLKTNTTLDYETKNSYTVTVTIQKGTINPLSDHITGPIINYSDADSIPVNINVRDVAEASQADALPAFTSEERERITSLLTLDTIIFNELFNASSDPHDWIELRNVTNADVDLGGWQLIMITSVKSGSVVLPPDTILPAGEVLLLLNTDPNAADMPLATSEESSYHYIVDETFILPQEDFMLLLRSPSAWEDSAGSYLFGQEKSPTTVDFALDTAWFRTKSTALGHQAEAWIPSGYHNGLGYDIDTSEDMRIGTPGHRRDIPVDANGDGIVNILDLVLAASQLGQSGETSADVNGDGTVNIQDLVVIANGLGNIAAAPSAHVLTAGQVEQWLSLAKQEVSRLIQVQTSLSQREFSYEHGIWALEQLLRMLVPKETALLANFPNPFNPETWMPYQLATASDVHIAIYDARDTLVRQFNLGHQSAGLYQDRNRAAYWDGTNALGESVASGIYFYTFITDDFSATRKMLILK